MEGGKLVWVNKLMMEAMIYAWERFDIMTREALGKVT